MIQALLLHLINARKVSSSTQKVYLGALKLLYAVTLGRPEEVVRFAWPRVPIPQPDILSGSEVVSLLDAIRSVTYRAIVLTAYGAGCAGVRPAICAWEPSIAEAVDSRP